MLARKLFKDKERRLTFVSRPVLFSVGLLAVSLASPFGARPQGSAPAKPNEELPAGAMQRKATTACLECHEARIILQQRLSQAAWAREVDKMVKWGAIVDSNDRDALIDYLSGNFSPDRPAYQPPRSSQQKVASKIGDGSRSK
jgi:hypothetical protein